MKQPADQPQKTSEQQQLEDEFRLDDEELCHAATKIQASFRGHMSRKQMDDPKETGSSKKQDAEEELDIDLTDPELNKAAIKIQASFKGHMVRKEHQKAEDE